MRKLVLLAALLCTITNAMADYPYIRGNELKQSCENDSPKDAAYCLGYVSATVDALGGGEFKIFCVPNGVTQEQLRDTTLEHLNTHSEQLARPAAWNVAAALAGAFPCEQ
jgi:hypothetical protein